MTDNARRTRFLYVGNHLGYLITHRLPLIQAALAEGYEVHVAVPSKADALQKMVAENAFEILRELGIQFHPVPLSRGSTRIGSELQTVAALFRLYRTLKPDIIYHATIKPVVYGGVISRLTSMRGVIYSLTGFGYVFTSKSAKARILQTGIRLILGFIFGHKNSRVLFQNSDDCNAFIREGLVKPAQTKVIKGSGVDLDKFKPSPEPDGEVVVSLPSRMLWDKGVGEFVEAAQRLGREGIRARFMLVGDADPDNPAAISRTQLEAWRETGIEWSGWRYDMPEVFRCSNIVCLPSYGEGMPKALIEAAASGRAIVTTDIPGCRDIVRDGVNGFLVPTRNADMLAERLKTLILDADLRHRMGDQSRLIAESEYSVETIIKATLQVCRELL